MKPRVTISISKHSLSYVDRLVGKRGPSRSAVVESLIRETRRQQQETKLARLAKGFFGASETKEDAEERADWLKASLETLKRDR